MPKRKAKRQNSSSAARRRPGARIVVAAFLIGSLFAAWTMLAYSGALDTVFPQKGDQKAPVSISSFNSNSPSKEYIYAGGRLIATEEPTGGGCASPSAPGTPTAIAVTTTSVSVNWAPSSGSVDHYEVERRNGSGSFAVVANVSGTSTTDTSGVIADTAYLYRVRAFADPSGACPSAYSAVDLATTTSFTSDPPVDVGTTIYASHLLRLRTAVNAVRLTAGLATFDWGDSTVPVTVAPATGGAILKDQMQKLRDRLNEARTAPSIGLPAQSYSNEPLAAGIKIFANHILELRQGVQ